MNFLVTAKKSSERKRKIVYDHEMLKMCILNGENEEKKCDTRAALFVLSSF